MYFNSGTENGAPATYNAARRRAVLLGSVLPAHLCELQWGCRAVATQSEPIHFPSGPEDGAPAPYCATPRRATTGRPPWREPFPMIATSAQRRHFLAADYRNPVNPASAAHVAGAGRFFAREADFRWSNFQARPARRARSSRAATRLAAFTSIARRTRTCARSLVSRPKCRTDSAGRVHPFEGDNGVAT